MFQNTIKVKKLNEDAKLPYRANAGDAGWDLFSVEDAKIYPKSRLTIKTGIAVEIPMGYVGLIWPRSGLSVKHGINKLAGVIDSGYRGEIIVCLHNTDEWVPFEIKKGDKIAQILFMQIPEFKLEWSENLEESERGENGFGSSG
jgi:dUTP pyrophosphatase